MFVLNTSIIIKLIMNMYLQIVMNVAIETEVVFTTVITPLALIIAAATLDINYILIGMDV